MAIDTDIFDSDLSTITADLPQAFTWQGTEYACTATDLTQGQSLEMEGFYEDIDLEITVRLALFESSSPARNDQITYESNTYRIERRLPSVDTISLRLLCVADTR